MGMEQLHRPIKIEPVSSIESEACFLQVDEHTRILESKESEHEVREPLTIFLKTEPLSDEEAPDKIKEEVVDPVEFSTEEECNKVTEVEENKTSCVVCGTAGQGPVCQQCQLPPPEDPHIPQLKLKEEVHKCKLCKRTYKTDMSLNRHTINAHSEKKKYECSICKKCFPVENNLKIHLLGHLDEFCLESMRQEQGKEYVSKDASFHCNICEKEFKRKASLNRHLHTHMSKQSLKCDFCEKVFTGRAKLKIHMRTHKDVLPFRCETSGKLFVDSDVVRTHLNIPAGDKCYKCTACKKVFSDRKRYNIHVFSHTGL